MKKYAIGLFVILIAMVGLWALQKYVPTTQIRLVDGRIVDCKEAHIDTLGRGWWVDMENNKHEESGGAAFW